MRVCKFFTLGTMQCKDGANCRFSHGVQVMSDFSAHKQSPIKSLAIMPEGPQILTGAGDSSIKVWNMSSGTPELTTTVTTPGPVQHIEINNGNTVLFSDDETAPDQNVPSGVVRILNQANPSDMASSIVVKVYFLCSSQLMYRTHLYFVSHLCFLSALMMPRMRIHNRSIALLCSLVLKAYHMWSRPVWRGKFVCGGLMGQQMASTKSEYLKVTCVELLRYYWWMRICGRPL